MGRLRQWARQFNQPFGVATDSADNVCVVDQYNSRVQKFSADGTYHRVGNPGLRSRRVLLALGGGDRRRRQHLRRGSLQQPGREFTSDGTFLTQWGTHGSENGQFFHPEAVAIDGAGNVYVTDTYNRVQKFTGDGTYLTQWGTYGPATASSTDAVGVATDSANHVYVADKENNRIQEFTGDGTYSPSGAPTAPATASSPTSGG